MSDKSKLPKKYQYLYDGMKEILTPEAFSVWYQNALDFDGPNRLDMPANPVKVKEKPNIKGVVDNAREAVSGYSSSNGARKAVEALADAIEQII